MTPRKKLTIIIVTFVAISLILIVIAVVIKSQAQTTPQADGIINQNAYVDPSTGDTVLDPPGKVPENADGPVVATILGPSHLIDIGLSSTQVDLLTSYLTDYASSGSVGSQKITDISIVLSTLTQNTDPLGGGSSITADITVNKTVRELLTIQYFSTTDLLVNINDTNKNQLFIDPSGD